MGGCLGSARAGGRMERGPDPITHLALGKYARVATGPGPRATRSRWAPNSPIGCCLFGRFLVGCCRWCCCLGGVAGRAVDDLGGVGRGRDVLGDDPYGMVVKGAMEKIAAALDEGSTERLS